MIFRTLALEIYSPERTPPLNRRFDTSKENAMSENKDVVIRMSSISKVFLTEEVETHALSQVHLEIMKGEFVAISGPSGCGKSTLLSILGLLDSPTEGSYLLNDKPVADLTLSERARIRTSAQPEETHCSRTEPVTSNAECKASARSSGRGGGCWLRSPSAGIGGNPRG